MSAAVAIAVTASVAASLASAGMSAYESNQAMHKGNEAKHKLAVEKDEMAAEQRGMEQKAKQEADMQLSQKRSRAGRLQSIATSPLGVADAAPIAKASLAGKSMLG